MSDDYEGFVIDLLVYWFGAECAVPDGAIDNLVKALESARQQGRREAQTWQPIETAPRDGQTVLLWGPEMRMGMSTWAWETHDDIEAWWHEDGKSEPRALRGPYPTQWMPLPPSPEPAQEKGK